LKLPELGIVALTVVARGALEGETGSTQSYQSARLNGV